MGLVVEDRITGASWDATEGGHDLAVELFEAKQNVGFVHRLEIKVGADHAVAVDDDPAHIGPDFGSIRGLDRSCHGWSGRHPIQTPDDQVDQVRSGDTGELSHVDIGNANCVSPITADHANFPLEMVTVGLVGVTIGVSYWPFTHIAVLKAGDLAFREGCMPSVRTPSDDPHAGIGIGGSTTVEDIVGSLGVGSVLSGVPRSEAGEAFRVDMLIAVDHGGGNLLGHAFKEGLDFRQPKLSGIAVEIGDVLVNYRVGFEVSTGIGDLRGGRFRVGDAVVEQPPSGLWETGSDGGFVSGGEVTFDDEHVI